MSTNWPQSSANSTSSNNDFHISYLQAPIKNAKIQENVDVHKKRAEAMYSIDEKSVIRKSHENPVLKQIYKEFLGEPNGELAHKLLHTHYSKKEKYKFVK